jgi:hypothetical protein
VNTDDPLRIYAWNWSALAADRAAFQWSWVRAAPPDGSRSDGVALVAGPPGARPTVGDDYLRIRFPHWAVILIFALLPAVRATRFGIVHWRRYRRLLVGRCPSCGYDLRGTVGRCPECGWAIGTSGAAIRVVR